MPGVFHHSSNNRMQHVLHHLLNRLEALGENTSERKFREKMEFNMCDEKKYHFRNKLISILLEHPDSDYSSSSSDSDSDSDSDSLCSDCHSGSDSGYESSSSLSSVLSSIASSRGTPREMMVEIISPRSDSGSGSGSDLSFMMSSGSDSGSGSGSDSDSGMENNIRIQDTRPFLQGAKPFHGYHNNLNR